MFIKLNHQSPDVYKAVRELTREIYFVSFKFQAEEKVNRVQQMKRAGLSVKLNLAEGSSRRSPIERKRYLEVSGGSLIEVNAILETVVDLKYFAIEEFSIIADY